MNDTIKQQLKHRTIREFTDQAVTPEELNTLLDVVNHTATSTGMQSFSIIRVTDPELKKKVAEVCMQEYVGRAPELMIFIVDCFRNAQIAKEQGQTPESTKDMDRFFQGFTDAALAVQNLTVAIESMGMGAVYLGSILNDAEKIIELLQLPPLTFPVVGIGFGHPNQDPQLKPRMPMEFKVFENNYHVQENYLEALKDYDAEMQTYYDLRNANQRVDSFTNQVIARYTQVIPKRTELLRIAKQQGFDLNVD